MNQQESPKDEPLKSAYERAMERIDREDAEPAASDEGGDGERIQVERVAEPEAEAGSADAQAEAAEFKDKYLRALAELDNFRKRSQRERADWTADAVRGMASDLLGVLDSLEMALASADADNPLTVGVRAVHDQFLNVLHGRGIEPIMAAAGDAFDPDLHQALMMEESEDVEGTVVGAVLRPGYTIKDKVLRPAQIKATRGKSPSSA